MAGDWIKMGTGLGRHPKVVRIASALKADRLRVVGGLHAVWCLFDEHSEDGKLSGYTAELVDEMIGWPGFMAALVVVEWAQTDGESLSLPRFEAHNGQSAKRRAMEADRKREARKPSAPDADKFRTREEKRREEDKKKELEPVARKRASPKHSCPKGFGISDGVRKWATEKGYDRLELHLENFLLACEAKEYKYADWDAAFKQAIRNDWAKLTSKPASSIPQTKTKTEAMTPCESPAEAHAAWLRRQKELGVSDER
jgi:hypothetical protein